MVQSGVTTVAGLGVLVARHLDADLRRGEQSMFRALLPYPEDMSEQRRETLHQHLLNKLLHRQPGYPDVVHVVPHIVAWGLGLPMAIHHPYGAPPYVIGPPSDDGEVPQPVVWFDGAYYLAQPRDPHDARIAEGFPSPAALTELRRLDVVFDEAIEVLKTEVDTAEQNTAIGHWPLLRDTFHRNVAAISQGPSSPQGLADVLEEHLRYRDALRAESTWEDENRWNLQDPFTIPVLVEDTAGRPTLRLRLDGNDTVLGYVDRVAVLGDRVAVDFGKVDGEGVGIARIPYTAPDGTERFAYKEIARRFTDSELAELWSTAAGSVWETVDRWTFGNVYHITAPVSEGGTFDITFGGQRVTLPPVEMADGLPPVIAAELREGRFRLGYGMDSRPLAVLEAPAGRNGTGAPLYLELSSPAPTAYDIERLRSMALWESVEPAALLDEVSIDLVMQEDRRTPNPLPLTFGDDNSGRTLDGQEVDLSAGTEVALRVGRFLRMEGSNVVTSIFAAVKAPLADQSGYAYRLVDTNLPNEWFDEFKTQWETTDSGKRPAAPAWPAGPLEKRPRTGGSSLPGGPAAFEWAGAASADGGVGLSSGWAAGVEPSVVRVDGGWRVSYRSVEGLPSWGEMTRVHSDRFTWRGSEPLGFVETPGEGRPFRVETAGEDAGVRVHVDHWVHRGSGNVVFRLRLEPDANVGRDSILRTLGAVEQWVVRTNERLRPEGGPQTQAVAVVFDPAAETVVRLSRYGSDLRDSDRVWVSEDGSAGRITQLHWLADLPSRAYGHELKHFAGVPHDGSPGDLLRTSRTVGDDHLHEPGFTAWELDQIRDTAASYVAPTDAPQPVLVPLGVPRDGRDLLSAFVASEPALVRTALDAGLPADLREFLSDAAGVRAAVAESVRTGVPQGSELGRVTELLRDHVSDYLAENAGRLPADVTAQRLAFREQHERDAAALSPDQAQQRVDELVDAGLLDPDIARARLDEMRANPADAGRHLLEVLTDPERQLDSGELAAVKAAVNDWANLSNSPAGRFLTPLLAHATDARMRVSQVAPEGVRPVGAYGPTGGTPVNLARSAADPERPGVHFDALVPETPATVELSAVPPQQLAPTPQPPAPAADDGQQQVVPLAASPDAPLVLMAEGLPDDLRLQRAVGGVLLHDRDAAPGPISSRVLPPTGPGPAILLHSSVLDPDHLGTALAGMRTQDTTMAVLHWPQDQPVTVARALEVTAQALGPQSSAMLSVPRSALRDRPTPSPQIVPLDANGEVTFFSGRPERYLFLPEVTGAPRRPAPYGLPEQSPGVYGLGDGWVVWDGGSHLWIGPATELDGARRLLPDTGGWLAEPVVFLGWAATALPAEVGHRVGRIFGGMPAAAPTNLITSGMGLDRRTLVPSEVSGLPAGVQLSHVPGGVLAHTGPRPPAGATTLNWSDLTSPDRPRLVVDESVGDPVAVVEAIHRGLPSGAGPLQVFVAPPAAGTSGTPSGAVDAARVAKVLRERFGGRLELVLPVSVVGRQPAGADELIPVDARGQETFPAAAHAWRVPLRPAPPRQPGPLGLRPAATDGYEVYRGWTVREQTGVVLFAQNGTSPHTLSPDALAAPASGVAVVVQSRGGPIPREVADTVARLLSGVPEADRDVRVFGNATSAGPAAPDPDGSSASAPALPATPDRRALALGDPKANLPDVDRVEQGLRAEVARRGVTVRDNEWEQLRERLLNNYPQLVSADGLLFTLGGIEVRARLRPEDPQLVANPAGSFDTETPGPSLDDTEGRTSEDGRFHANQFTQGVFQTGAHSQSDGTTTRAMRLRGGFNVDVPLGPMTHWGPNFNATLNKVDQKSAYLIDAEKGRVFDTRADSTFYSYEPGWLIEARGDGQPWQAVEVPEPADGQEAARLVVAIPDHLLENAGEQVVADLPEHLRDNLTRVPELFSASNITGLNELYDHIIDRLRADGFDMSIESPMRNELQRKLWNLETHFDEAVNNRRTPETDGDAGALTRGYAFTLHDDGHAAASIRVYGRRLGGSVQVGLGDGSTRVGASSDKAHIEQVRTGIVGQGGEFTLGQSAGLSFGGAVDLPLARRLDDPQAYKESTKLGLSARAGMSWTSNDGGGVTVASLNVVVGRYTGQTVGHEVRFEFHAEVITSRRPREWPHPTPVVDGSVVLRMSEPDSFDYGFSVDADAFAPDPVPGLADGDLAVVPAGGRPRSVPHDQWRPRLRNTGVHPEDTGGNLLPRHVIQGRGLLGQALPRIDKPAVRRLRAGLMEVLAGEGFLPADGDRPWAHGEQNRPATPDPGTPLEERPLLGRMVDGARDTYDEVVHRDTDATIDNLDLFNKMVSGDGLESHFDSLVQDGAALVDDPDAPAPEAGMSFTLNTWRNAVKLTAEVTVFAIPRITADVDADGNSVHFERLSDEVSTVTLGMSLGIAGQGASGNQGWSVEGGVNTALPPSVKDVRSVGLLGGSVSRNVGAAERVTRVVNRPELKEYGGRVMFVNAPYDLGYVVRISDRDAPIVSPELIPANVHAALLKFNSDPATFSEVAPGDVAPSALHQGIVYFVDAHGLRAAAQNQLPRDLTLAGRPMTGPVASLTNHVTFQARFKEAMLGQYGATTLVEPGFWANTNAALSVKVPRIRRVQFVGATPDQYVTGLIELYLAETVNVANESFTKAFNLPNIGLSRKFGPVNVGFGESAGVRVSKSESAETKRVGGLEMLKLAFGRGYAYVAEFDANVRAGVRTQVGFAASRVSVPPGADLRDRTMLFILPEAEALAQYAAGKLPVSDVQLVDAMGRWSRGELVLSGNTVAGLLSRWRGELADRVAGGLPDLGAYLIQHRVQTWALTLADRHVDLPQRGAVLAPRRRERFATEFGITLDPNANPFSALTMPPYLTRTGDRTLGHAGVDDLVLFTGPAPADGGPRPTTTVLDAVRELVDAGRPGLLGASHDNWPGAGTSWGVLMVSPDESVVGALPGGLETLQSTLAGQRANIVFADMLHRYNGVTFYLVDQRNPVAAQMFKLKVSGTLGGRPRYTGWRADYGIENYEHAYGATARIIGQSLGWNLTPARFGFSVDGVPVSTAASLSFAPGGGRGVKGAAQVVRERTVYDWTGNYEAEDDIGLTMELSRVQMHGWQPSYLVNHVLTGLNNAADWALHRAPAGFANAISLAPVEPVLTRHYEGRIDFKVPRGLAEATPVPRSPQLDLRALPSLPGDAYVSAALVDDLYPAARHLMGKVLGPQANAPLYRGSVALDGLLSRLNVDNHLSEGLDDGGYLLGSHLFVAGSSNNRVAMRMYVKLHSLEIISELATTGTGRYAKFAFTTSATQSRSRWRPNVDVGMAYGAPIGKTNIGPQEDTTATGGISTGANRNAPASHSATFDDTKRLENHLKMQGRTYLVRIRTQARFVAVPHQHSAFHRDAGLAPMEPARFEADDAPGTGWMSGDGFYEMFADEVHELQRALSERYDWKANNPADWPAPAADAPTIGLEGLLQRATPAGMAAAPVAGRVIDAGTFDPQQAPQHVALLIRDQIGNHYDPVSPLRLTASAAEQTRLRYEVVLDWAVGHLQRLNPVQQAAAGLAELTAWKNRVGKFAVGAVLPATDVRQFAERIPQIVERVQAVQPPGSPSVTPPEEVELLAQDPRTVARVVAFELKTHLDLTVTDDQGTASRYRIDPQGWIVALREGPDGTFAPVTAPEVIFDLDRDLKLRADAAGIRLRRQMALYHELLSGTPVQMDAAAELGPELETHIRQARADADDRAREWITEGLPAKPANPLAVHTARDDTDTAGTRAGQARRLLAAVLPSGWTTTGPLPQAPDMLRPGTRVWITRPQGAAAARIDVDGTYRLYDPFALGTAERTLDAQQFRDVLAGAQAVTLVEPDVLTSWLLQDGNWAASRQLAEDNLEVLRADPTAARLTQDQQQARPASPSTAPAQPETVQPDAARPGTTPAPAGDPVLDRHRALLDAIRAGQLTAAYDYLAAADATARHRALADAVAAVVPADPTAPADPAAPAGLRALADLVDADPRVTRPRPGPEAVSDAGILRAVADILDPAVGALDTFRAIASAAWTINPPQNWPDTLQALTELPTAAGRDVATLRDALDIIERQRLHGVADLLDGLTPDDAGAVAAAVTASGTTATDLADAWRDVSTAADLIPALPPPAATWAGTADTVLPPADVVHHPMPPVTAALDEWLTIGDWEDSRTFLDDHGAELLSDRAHSALQIRRAGLPHNVDLAARDALLTLARYGHLDDGYRYLLGPTPPASAAAGTPNPLPGAPTGRQELLTRLLARPDVADPAAVSALGYLAATLDGPVNAVDAAILHLTADALAGLNIADAAVTTLVRDARQTLSAPQRQQWAETIRHLADNATGTRGPALRHVADRLFTTTPDPDPAPDASDASDAEVARVRQVTRERLQQASQELQRTVDDLDQARRDERDAQGARDAAEASLDAARTAVTRAEGERARLEENIDHLNRAMPELEAEVTRRERLESAARQTVDDPATSQDESRRAAARAELDQARRELDVARTALENATGDLRDAGQDLDRVRAELPDLRRQVETASEELRARDVSAQAHTNTVRMLDEARTVREAARDAAQQQADAMALPVPPVPRSTPVVDVDTALAEIARAGHGRSVVPELERAVRAEHGGTLPARVVLNTNPTRQADNAATAPADETAVHELDRVQLARDLAATLAVPVELRVDGGTSVEPPYLAYPGGEVVRLDITGRPETLDDAVRRLPQRVQDDLAAHRGRPDVNSRLEILHEAEIESRQDFATAVVALVENLNRHQGYLAHRWITQAVPPVDAAGLRALTDGLDTRAWPEPTSTPPAGPVETGRPDAVAAAWLAYIPQHRAEMLADMLDAVPGLGFVVGRPTRELPADQRPGARVLAVAGSTAAAGVVLPTTQLHWYEPARNQIHTGSMQMLGTWAKRRAGEDARPDDIWYIVLTPNGTDRPRDPSALAHHVDVAARTTSTSTPPVEPAPPADVAGAVRGDVSLPGGAAAFEWAGAASADGGVGSSSGWAAGVEPSVVRVVGGWRVSYRSMEGLPSWGEMTRVYSDRFTWRGPEPLRFVSTPGEGRPFRVETAGEDAGVRVYVDYWVRGESGTVVFRLRLEPDADVVEESILRTLGAVEQWVVRTNERLRPEGGPPAVAVVFDPAAETVVRLSPYGSGLKNSKDVWVSEDGSAGRINQLHWLAGLPSRAYGHELKHFAGVPHDGSPGDLLRTARGVGDDHLHEPGFTEWELDQIRDTAASYVAPTVAPRPAGSSGSGSVSSEPVSGSLPGRPAAMEWHPPDDSEADGQPSGPAEGDPSGLDPEVFPLWDDPLAGLDLTTPAAGSGWSPSGGQRPDWEREVADATGSLKLAGAAAEAAFGRWAREVFEFDPATLDPRPNYVFNESVLDTYREELEKKGITTPAGLSGWLARQLAKELAPGGSPRLREILPYPDPENMSEQQRDALHRIWIDKIANPRSVSYEITHVALHLLAMGLGQQMRIHHPFGDPYEDIGPPSDDGAIPRPVVWWKGGYIVLIPRDSADILARIASGYRRKWPDRVRSRWDSLFSGALGLLKDRIDTAEENSPGPHRSVLRHKLDRDLAAIGKRPFSPRRQAEELDAYHRYLTGLSGDGAWTGDYRWELKDPFTLRIAAHVKANSGAYAELRFRLGGKDVQLTRVDHVVLPGDRVAVDFGSVNGEGVGIVKIPYLADGAEKFAYREIERRFSDSELAELRGSAPGHVWQLDEPSVSSLFHITAGLDPKKGLLTRSFGKGSEGNKLQRVRIPVVKVADGSSFVIPGNMKEAILRLGYGPDGRPIAVVVMPAEKSGVERDLYLQLVNPAPTVADIELLRKTALWERDVHWWSTSRVESFDDTIGSNGRLPSPLSFTLGGIGAKTLDGREVNLAPGTPVTLQVGKRLRPVGNDDAVNEVVVVVKVPLVPEPNAPASEPEYAFRVFVRDEADYAALIRQLRNRRTLLDQRRERAESGGRRAPKRPRIQDGSSQPGPATAPHQPPPPPDMAGEAGRGDVLLPSQLSPAEVSVWFPWLGSVNPGRADDPDSPNSRRRDSATNCVLAAVGTDMSLADGVGWQVPPEVPSPVGWLQRFAGRPLVEVADYEAVVEVMAGAEPGARGVLVTTGVGDEVSHAVNVVRTYDGRVVFLDGQLGGLARGPVEPGRLRFVATTDGVGIPRPPAGVADAATVTVAEHADLAGMDGNARPPSEAVSVPVPLPSLPAGLLRSDMWDRLFTQFLDRTGDGVAASLDERTPDAVRHHLRDSFDNFVDRTNVLDQGRAGLSSDDRALLRQALDARGTSVPRLTGALPHLLSEAFSVNVTVAPAGSGPHENDDVAPWHDRTVALDLPVARLSAVPDRRGPLIGHFGEVLAVTSWPAVAGWRLASADVAGTVRVWDMDNGVLLRELEGHYSGVLTSWPAVVGPRLASADVAGAVRVWDVDNGVVLRELGGHTGAVVALTGWPAVAGPRLASADAAGTVRVWDADNGVLLQTFEGNDGLVRVLTSWQDESGWRRLAAGDVAGRVRIWDVDRGVVLQTLEGHDGVEALTLLPEGPGRWLLAVGQRRAVRLWSLSDGVAWPVGLPLVSGERFRTESGHGSVVVYPEGVSAGIDVERLAAVAREQAVTDAEAWAARTGQDRPAGDAVWRVVLAFEDRGHEDVLALTKRLIDGELGVEVPEAAVIELSPYSADPSGVPGVQPRTLVEVAALRAARAESGAVAILGRHVAEADPGVVPPGLVAVDFSGRETFPALLREVQARPINEDVDLDYRGRRRLAGLPVHHGPYLLPFDLHWARLRQRAFSHFRDWVFLPDVPSERGLRVTQLRQAELLAGEIAAASVGERLAGVPDVGPAGWVPAGARVLVVGVPGPYPGDPKAVVPSLFDFLNGALPPAASGLREPVYVVVHGFGGWTSTVVLTHAAEDDLWPVRMDELATGGPAGGGLRAARDLVEAEGWTRVLAEVEGIPETVGAAALGRVGWAGELRAALPEVAGDPAAVDGQRRMGERIDQLVALGERLVGLTRGWTGEGALPVGTDRPDLRLERWAGDERNRRLAAALVATDDVVAEEVVERVEEEIDRVWETVVAPVSAVRADGGVPDAASEVLRAMYLGAWVFYTAPGRPVVIERPENPRENLPEGVQSENGRRIVDLSAVRDLGVADFDRFLSEHGQDVASLWSTEGAVAQVSELRAALGVSQPLPYLRVVGRVPEVPEQWRAELFSAVSAFGLARQWLEEQVSSLPVGSVALPGQAGDGATGSGDQTVPVSDDGVATARADLIGRWRDLADGHARRMDAADRELRRMTAPGQDDSPARSALAGLSDRYLHAMQGLSRARMHRTVDAYVESLPATELGGLGDRVGQVETAAAELDQHLGQAPDTSSVDVIDGVELRTLEGHTGAVWAVTSWQGEPGPQVASASDDGTVRIWDAVTGAPLRTLRGHTDGVVAVESWQAGPDRRVATADMQGAVFVWDAVTGARLLTLRGHVGPVWAVTSWPGEPGPQVASASDDGTVFVWDAVTGARLLTLGGHTGGVGAVASWQAGADRRLASADWADGTVFVWDVASGARLLTLRGHTGGVVALASWQAGSEQRLASASWDGTVRVWDAVTGAP
ncbi:hypothetical protein CA850_26380, partial [Micromonospora echinospora]